MLGGIKGTSSSPLEFSTLTVNSNEKQVIGLPKQIKEQVSRGFYIDYNQVVSTTSHQYVSSRGFDTTIVAIPDDTTQIIVSGATPSRYNFYRDFEPIEANLLETNETGKMVNGARFCYISFNHESNPNGYSNLSINYEKGYAFSEDVRNGLKSNSVNRCFIDRNHMVNVSADNQISYKEYTTWDCCWIPIPQDNINALSIKITSGFTFSAYRFFTTFDEPSQSTYIASFSNVNNQPAPIPSNAKLCCISLKKSDNPDLTNFSYSIEDSIMIKNYINRNDLLYGYIISSGQWSPNTYGVATNKLFFEDGKTYAMQGIRAYGVPSSIYIGYFDENDNYLGRTSVVADTTGAYATGFGKGLFTFNKNTFSMPTAYCRIVLRTNEAVVPDYTKCQIELGKQYTEVVSYGEKWRLQNGKNKTIKLLSIGNSYSQDALAYVPYILENMGLNLDIQIGILMMSSSSLSNHVDNFNNETSAYTFYLYQGNGSTWQNLGSKTIQWALDNYYWNEISLQQSSSDVFKEYNTYYQPYLNQLINLISNYIDHSVKFGWYAVQARPASTNSGANWSDSEITTHYQAICSNAQKVINETICEFLIPVNTAIQNARSISAIKALGDYASNPLNTSGLGYLTPNDGVHLQEGLPCQIAAYSFILSLLDLYGLKEYSILGETTRVTAEWASGKNIPGPHGNYIGSTDQNSIIAQQCAIMAMKNPYQLTDMNYIINPT